MKKQSLSRSWVMGSDYQVVRMKDAPLEIIDGDRGKNYPSRNDQFKEGFCLFLNAGNVTSEGFDFESTVFISKKRDELLRKGKLKRKDIVLTTRGTVGRVAFYDEKVPFDHIRINSGMVIFRTDNQKLDPRFTYYFLRSRSFENQVQSLRTGSAQPQLPIRDINRIEIPIPPLDEQKRIAHILGTLDDKIELNQRMNETLEEIARAVFKSWFVDFDPVRAKMAGEPNTLPDEVMALFPDELVESELGMIPKGWKIKKIKEIGKIVTGKTPSTKVEEFYNSQDIPFIKIPDMHNNLIIDKTGNYLSLKGAKSQSNKFLPPNSICVSCIATPGLVSLTSRFSQTNQQINSIIPNNDYLSVFLLFSMARKGQEIRMSGSGGSVISNLNKNDFSMLKIIYPNEKIIMEFTRIVFSLIILVREISSENLISFMLRDELISKFF
jgi:type I restriction enzyme, S subunit